MTLRGKLLLSQMPLIVALAVTAAVALYAAVRFGGAPGEILYQNFRSFDAARSMLHAVDLIDQSVLSATVQKEKFSAAEVANVVASFERELRLQRSNVTEAGERDATDRLGRLWGEYLKGLDDVTALSGLTLHREHSLELRTSIDRVMQMNRDAMRRKSERAREDAEHLGAVLTATAVAAFLVAVLLSNAWIRRILAPLRVLERGVQRVSAGDFEARIRVQGSDEIAALSKSFNDMAMRLSEYRQSSIGELLDANNRLGSVMDSLADAVVVYDLDGAPVATNEVAARLLGTERPHLHELPEALEDAVRHAFERVRQSGEAFEPPSLEAAVEVPAVPAPRWVLVGATPVRTRREVLSGVTVAMRDVTRARRIEGFKGDLVAAAAHELRTPLTSLHMAVHLCLEQAAGPLTDRQQDLLATARQDCERLQAVVEELLEMARLESGAARLAKSKINVGEFLRDARSRHETQARQHGKRLEVVPGDSLITIDADYGRLQRVLDNLIENAFVHAGEGGRVALGFERLGDSVQIHVDDSGPGIAPELRGRVFAKFFRVPGTTKPGSGLGLSIVEDIVHAHGGAVGVGSSELGGARVWFSIPSTPTGHARDSDPSSSSS